MGETGVRCRHREDMKGHKASLGKSYVHWQTILIRPIGDGKLSQLCEGFKDRNDIVRWRASDVESKLSKVDTRLEELDELVGHGDRRARPWFRCIATLACIRVAVDGSKWFKVVVKVVKPACRSVGVVDTRPCADLELAYMSMVLAWDRVEEGLEGFH